MKLFLVGGAVRDQLLGLPVKEQDWVVVGAHAQDLLSEGYQQVGRDFPVFLHPTTREEYALARTEKKQGAGYHGFICDASASVTLEEDLARRDLTINAIAMDSEGQLVDPYHGQADLKHKILRHVSAAFVEDPVRVLRIARFKARFHHLGFELAPETLLLMQEMVRKGELTHLTAERVWREWQLSLAEKNPELFITTLRLCGALKVVLPELDALFGVPNKRMHHPEVDVGVHTLMALTQAVKLSSDPMVRFAILMHDVGKAQTPMSMWPNQQGHNLRGLPSIDALCQRLRVPKRYQKLALLAARWHGELHAVSSLTATVIVTILDKTNAFRDPNTFEQLLTICEADSKGRGVDVSAKMPVPDYHSAQVWRIMLAACDKLTAEPWVRQGLLGADIKEALFQARVTCVSDLLKKQ